MDRVAANRHLPGRNRRTVVFDEHPRPGIEGDDVALSSADAPDGHLVGLDRDAVVGVAEVDRPGHVGADEVALDGRPEVEGADVADEYARSVVRATHDVVPNDVAGAGAEHDAAGEPADEGGSRSIGSDQIALDREIG